MAEKEGGLANLSPNQQALVAAIVIAAVAGVLYVAQQYQATNDNAFDYNVSMPSEEEKMEILAELEARNTEPELSEEEKMRILEKLEARE
jgi:hypothetical protein